MVMPAELELFRSSCHATPVTFIDIAHVQRDLPTSSSSCPKGVLRSFLGSNHICRHVVKTESLSGLSAAWVAVYSGLALIALLCLVLPAIRYIYRQFRTRHMPLVGLLDNQGWLGWRVWLQLQRDAEAGQPGASTQEWAHPIGQVLRIRGFEWDTVYVTNKNAMNQVLSDPKKRFGKAPRRAGGWLSPSWAPFLQGGMLVSDGTEWIEYNNATKHWLRKSDFGGLSRMENIFQDLVSKLRARPKRNGDLQPLLNEYVKDAVLLHLMKLDPELTPVAEEWSSIRDAADFCSNVIYWRFRSSFISKLMFWKRIPEWLFFNSATRKIHAVIDNNVDKALKMRETAQEASEKDESILKWQGYLERFGFIEHLYTKLGRDPIKVRWEILELIAAGTDTTASLLTHTLYELSRHPEQWDILRSEILTMVEADEIPTENQLKEMKWLNAVIKETLRFHPSSGGPTRFALSDAQITLQEQDQGTKEAVDTQVLIPKGTFVLLGTRQLHRDVDKWGPSADSFLPQRWLDRDDFQGPNSLYRIGGDYFKPFSSGSRACPGKNWALLVARYFLARFCQTFISIKSEDPEEYRCTIRLGTSIRSGLQVRLVEPGPGYKISFEYLHGTTRSSTTSKPSLSVRTSHTSMSSHSGEVLGHHQTPDSSLPSSRPQSPGSARSAEVPDAIEFE